MLWRHYGENPFQKSSGYRWSIKCLVRAESLEGSACSSGGCKRIVVDGEGCAA